MGLLKKAEESRKRTHSHRIKGRKKIVSGNTAAHSNTIIRAKEAAHPKRGIKQLKEEVVKKDILIGGKRGASKNKTVLNYNFLITDGSQKTADRFSKIPIKKRIDIRSIKKEIHKELDSYKSDRKLHKKDRSGEFIYTGIGGFDNLLDNGIPVGSAVLVAGGAGSGKTILCLQLAYAHALDNEKVLYMSFEESEERLIKHMESFGWDPKRLIKKKNLMIKRFNPFDITRSVDALMMKAQGELLIDVDPIIFPEGFKPKIIIVDSLTAIASAFTGKEESYRIYIEQLFRFFEEINATSFMITETEQIPKIFSPTGVEEFLADAVVVIYNIKKGNIRERAIEILKLRGAGHKKKIVAMNISKRGIDIYPEQEVFGRVESR